VRTEPQPTSGYRKSLPHIGTYYDQEGVLSGPAARLALGDARNEATYDKLLIEDGIGAMGPMSWPRFMFHSRLLVRVTFGRMQRMYV
jgi:hypothetical protein